MRLFRRDFSCQESLGPYACWSTGASSGAFEALGCATHSDKLNEVPSSLRLTMAYDQDKEGGVKHAEITQKTRTAYFADPHAYSRGILMRTLMGC